MLRAFLALLLMLCLAPGMCTYETQTPWSTRNSLTFTPVPLPSPAKLKAHLGAFTLEQAWVMTDPHSRFFGWSALLPLGGGRLLAVSDAAATLQFSPPGVRGSPAQLGEALPRTGRTKADNDVESATRDPATGTIWLGREGSNSISRHDPDFHTMVAVRPMEMRDWPNNTGPEAMVRLADGRFVVLEEGFTTLLESHLHHAVVFPTDPILRDRPVQFLFAGDPEFSPTDMAQLPDGRVLILMRRLVWPMPLRFVGRIMIADPNKIRPGAVWEATEVAKLSSTLPVDNFEGLAIEPGKAGRVTVWLISDDNAASTQRTLLWKLSVNPKQLP